ncbi:site-specific integrase [Streptomonospora sp. PA3]|uniref:tyrosine-type recombinase/integrase n=1 Tax=Streptomonospora sp. PA3 TaxID=2607326 RepID=UPI0012DE034A|nr:tyrosine-type recombinase/integrase [Streptomonospora sp. PA3]MUL41630.1 site-specific integrase [Streptomonospora sp. PA3]
MTRISEGTTFKRCGCADPATGKRLGAACPKLKRRNGSWNPGHGSWAYQIELPPASPGKRRQARRTGLASHEAAAAALERIRALLELAEDDYTRTQIADLIQRIHRTRAPLPQVEEVRARLLGGAVTDEVPTVGEWLHSWVASADIAASTRRSYRQHIRTHLEPHLGPIPLDKLRLVHIQACFDALEERNAHIRACRASDDEKTRASVRGQRIASPATQHRIRATLRRALNVAISRPDLPITLNPAAHLVLPSCPRQRPLVWTRERVQRWRRSGEVPGPVMVWTPEQTRTFLERARRDRLYALFHLIAFKGLRRGEAVGLPWSNTRLEDQAIDIRTQIVQLGWETTESTPKSEAGQRTITLDAETTRVLKRWRRRQNRERLAAGPYYCDTGLAFTHPDGSALHPAQVTLLFQRLQQEADLPPVRLHDLRHGAASLSLAAGVDVKIVSAELGHATTTFTQDVYQSVFPQVARQAAEATADLITGRSAHQA